MRIYKRPSYNTIQLAVDGDLIAMHEIVQFYEHYINEICTLQNFDVNDTSLVTFNKDLKNVLVNKLLQAVEKFNI